MEQLLRRQAEKRSAEQSQVITPYARFAVNSTHVKQQTAMP
jgi:hypothetical protein